MHYTMPVKYHAKYIPRMHKRNCPCVNTGDSNPAEFRKNLSIRICRLYYTRLHHTFTEETNMHEKCARGTKLSRPGNWEKAGMEV